MVNRLVSVGDDFTLPAAVMGPLNATYATKATGAGAFNRQLTLHVLGDSNSQNGLNLGAAANQGVASSDSKNPWIWAHVKSGGKLRIGLIGATGGYTSTQIKDTWLPQVIAKVKPGDYVAVMAGTNDSALTGGIGGTATKANLTAMYDAIKAAGGTVVACSILPATNDTAAMVGNRARLNLWIEETARAQGYIFADVHSEVVDPATGFFLAGYNNDDLHLNGGGARKIGQMIATLLTPPEAPQPFLAGYNIGTGASPADGLLRLGNALMLTDTNADGRADQWFYGFGTLTGGSGFSLVTEPGVPGKMQKVTRGATGPDNVSAITDYTINSVPGNKYYVAFKFRIDLTDPAVAGTAKAVIQIAGENGAALAGITEDGWDFSTQGVCTWASTFVMPDIPTDLIMITVGMRGGAGSVQVGQLTLVDLTAQGIA